MRASRDPERAALRHGIDSVEDQIGQDLTDLRGVAEDGGQAGKLVLHPDHHATLLGLPFLTAGMLAGIIRAETFNVPSWWIDPMVLLALFAWALYAVLLWGRVRADWVGGRLAWLAVTGLVVLLVIRFAAVPYFSGFHTYGG